jgi:hypothetical protein
LGDTPVLERLTDGKDWDESTYGVLADFSSLVTYVQIDLIFNDDDQGGLWAYDQSAPWLGQRSGRETGGNRRGLRPLWKLRREYPDTPFVVVSERGGPEGENRCCGIEHTSEREARRDSHGGALITLTFLS